MITRDKLTAELAARRALLMERAETGRDELARRAEEIRERFSENMTAEVVTSAAGWTLISTGIAWGVTDWLKGRRLLRSLIFPAGLIVLGVAVLGGGAFMHRRGGYIDEAEMAVREQISKLDPFARLRVLRDVAEESVPFVRRISVRN